VLSIDFVPHHGWLAVAPRDEEILAHVVIVGFVQLEACLVCGQLAIAGRTQSQ